jgi:two-component system response regulator ChvI
MKRRCCPECGTVIASSDAKLYSGPLLLDRALRRVNWRGHDLHLSPQEFEFLELLVIREGRVVQTWAFFAADIFEEDVDDKIVDVIACKLRSKLRAVDPGFNALETRWGEGYLWRRAEGRVVEQMDRAAALRERVARAGQ